MSQPGHIQPTQASASLIEYVISNMMIEMLVTTHQHRTGPCVICGRRTLQDYNYIWAHTGSATWILEDTAYPVNEGDLLLVPKGVPHQGIMAEGEVTLGSIHVLPTLPGGRDVFNLLQLPIRRTLPKDSRLWKYLVGSIDEWQRSEPSHVRPMLRAWTRLITIELIRHDFESGQLHAVSVDPLVHEVLDYLNRSIDHSLTLENLAEISGFSAQHLNRTFKKVLGMTPLQYLTHMKLQKAAELLADGRWTVASVAEQVGYEDPYYFSRLFKKHFGMAPAHWREHSDEAAASTGSYNPS